MVMIAAYDKTNNSYKESSFKSSLQVSKITTNGLTSK